MHDWHGLAWALFLQFIAVFVCGLKRFNYFVCVCVNTMIFTSGSGLSRRLMHGAVLKITKDFCEDFSFMCMYRILLEGIE